MPMSKGTQKTKAHLKRTQAGPPRQPQPSTESRPLDQRTARDSDGLKTAGPALAFFAVYALCLWKWVDVKLIYHAGGYVKDFPTFYWGWEFAREFRTRPGGLVEYGSALLAQSTFSSWFGSVVLTLQAALAYLGVAGCLRIFGGQRF